MNAAPYRREVNGNDSGSNTRGRLDCGEELLGLVSLALFFELVMLRYVFAFVLPSCLSVQATVVLYRYGSFCGRTTEKSRRTKRETPSGHLPTVVTTCLRRN